VAGMPPTFDGVNQMAKDAGRDPAQLKMVVHANVESAIPTRVVVPMSRDTCQLSPEIRNMPD
jgi:hypothetical protein